MKDVEIVVFNDKSWVRLTEYQKVKEENEQLKQQIEKMKGLLSELYSEFGFSELVKIRNDLPIEVKEAIKEIKEK